MPEEWLGGGGQRKGVIFCVRTDESPLIREIADDYAKRREDNERSVVMRLLPVAQ